MLRGGVVEFMDQTVQNGSLPWRWVGTSLPYDDFQLVIFISDDLLENDVVLNCSIFECRHVMDTAFTVFHFMIHLVSKSLFCPFEFLTQTIIYWRSLLTYYFCFTKRLRCCWIYREACGGLHCICSRVQNCNGMLVEQALIIIWLSYFFLLLK